MTSKKKLPRTQLLGTEETWRLKQRLKHFDLFSDHVTALHIDSDVGFSKEYDEIQKHSRKVVKATHDHSSNPENKTKNRYLNIVACEFLSLLFN